MNTGDPRIVTTDTCWGCGQLKTFGDPDTIPVVLIDPATNKPPDIDPHPDGLGAARAVRQPLCAACVDVMNRAAVDQGLAAPFPGEGDET